MVVGCQCISNDLALTALAQARAMSVVEHQGAQCVSSLSCCATGNRRVYVLSHAWTLESGCGYSHLWYVQKSYAAGNPTLYETAAKRWAPLYVIVSVSGHACM